MITKRYLRLAFILLGFTLIIWLPFEDTSLVWVIAFTLAITGFITIYFLDRFRKGANHWWHFPLIGLLAGLAITPLALLLMAIKSGIHGHGFPDFTPAQIVQILQLTPLWILAGLITGSAAAMIVLLKAH